MRRNLDADRGTAFVSPSRSPMSSPAASNYTPACAMIPVPRVMLGARNSAAEVGNEKAPTSFRSGLLHTNQTLQLRDLLSQIRVLFNHALKAILSKVLQFILPLRAEALLIAPRWLAIELAEGDK